MTHLSRASLLAFVSLSALTALTAHAAELPGADQSTTATAKGQANDKTALTTSDIVVTATVEVEKAPSIASLTTTQPQAVIGRTFIDTYAPVTSDFFQLAVIAPSVTITGANNGFGFGESKLSIRGFQDGDFNTTYDSIPFADTNNPTHHTTSFFPSNTIETLVVDRGPGNASQLGQATYGGDVNIYSRAATDNFGIRAQGTAGSYKSFIGRLEVQSGEIAALGGAKLVVTGNIYNSEGAQTFSPTNGKNVFAKLVAPIGSKHTLTVLATYNANTYYQSDSSAGTCGDITGKNCVAGATIALYGKLFGLVDDNSVTNKFAQNYYGYNRTQKQTDFEYVRLQSEILPGLTLDNRVYMYGYTNHTLSGQDGTGATANTVILTPGTKAVAGIPGYDKLNKYRNIGYIGTADYAFKHGHVKVGGWYEYSDTNRHLFNYDLVTRQPNYREGTVANVAVQPPANVRYYQGSDWHQYQFFGEVEYEVLPGLFITPGVKYINFERGINAPVNQTTRAPLYTKATWTDTLPFATVRYEIKSNWSAYFQYAKGIYVPDLSSFYSASLNLPQSLSQLQPQRSTNYQLGTVYHGRLFAFDGDIYKIDVANKIAASSVDPTLLVNIGEVEYKGAEAQLNVFPLPGLTVFVNGSYNVATSGSTHAQIAKAPYDTEAVGVFYHSGRFFGSYVHKFTGPQWGSEANTASPFRLYRIDRYSQGDLAVGMDVTKALRLSLNVNNIFDEIVVNQIKTSSKGAPTTVVNGVTVQSGYGTLDQLFFTPPRSIQGTVSFRY